MCVCCHRRGDGCVFVVIGWECGVCLLSLEGRGVWGVS